MSEYIDGLTVAGTDYELHDTDTREQIGDLKSAFGALSKKPLLASLPLARAISFSTFSSSFLIPQKI